ncbi:SIS domain-containing protein [Sphingomonas sp. 2SG]|uniref:sugar isomerase domain-containing protein n=1 Tax=Sphingomonas sp. 2SG TaxID=2502201 RepID=UPI001485366F|nr:SIS domain-containing protein [Sphingomonas sp. 2SG]
MGRFTRDYRDAIVRSLDEFVASQDDAFDRGCDAVASALSADRIIYVAGSGHSHLIAEEAFYRAGGVAAVQAMLDPDLMLHVSATRSSSLEREPGRAEALLANYPVAAGDVVVVVSNSGRNAFPIEMALACRSRGATVIAITSLRHSRSVDSLHPSGQRLFEVCDIVLDNGAVPGDASVPAGPHGPRMGPTSTILGAFIINALLAEATARLVERGITIDVYQSANTTNGDIAAADIAARWKPRLKGL